MQSQGSTPEQLRDFFQREVLNLDGISGPGVPHPHPNIIRYVESFCTPAGFAIPEGIPVCIVMEYAGAGCQDMYDTLRNGNIVSEEQAKNIFRKICSAVKHLHDMSVIHRDIKSENVLLVPTDPIPNTDHRGVTTIVPRVRDDPDAWEVKLIDFGLSKAINPGDLNTMNRGTYKAQEIAGGNYSAPSDCYALGVTLFTMVAKRLPNNMQNRDSGGKPTGRLNHGVHAVITPSEWPRTNPISDECKELILALIAHNPSTRPTVDQVLNHRWLTPPASLPTPAPALLPAPADGIAR
jgi:serine/threonine protein kinase